MRLMVGGDERVSRFHDAGVNEDYDVELRLAEGSAMIRRRFRDSTFRHKDGKLVRLDSVVKLQPARSVSQINRLDRQRQVTLQASVAPGYGLADRNQAINAGGARFEHAGGLFHSHYRPRT